MRRKSAAGHAIRCILKVQEVLNVNSYTFQLPVTGSNLAGVCKLVFKVARNDKNDKLFLEGNILGQ